MRTSPLLLAALAAPFLLSSADLSAQQIDERCWINNATAAEAAERASPLRSTQISMGEESAVLCYGAPSMNDREIWGGLVPLGQPWRMGANEATAIHMPFAGTIGGVEVEPGAYSLYMVPGENEVEIFVNPAVERWGIPITPDLRANDVGSFTRTVAATESPVEQLTFRWESHGENMGHLVMEWENTRVEIPVHRGMM